MTKSILKDKSYQFAIAIVKLAQNLQGVNREFALSKQILRSGTAIGAIIREEKLGKQAIQIVFNDFNQQ